MNRILILLALAILYGCSSVSRYKLNKAFRETENQFQDHTGFVLYDIKKKKTNLLFFGNFHGMKLENYEWGVKEMMKDSDFLYGSIIKDIYFNGKVLARKYMLLRISYSIFMFGFVASILAFLISMLIFYYPS